MMPMSRTIHSPPLALQGTDAVNQLYPSWQEWLRIACPAQQQSEALSRLQTCALLQLTELDLSGLNLRSLPQWLPPGLIVLRANRNQLTCLPENLPDSLIQLEVMNNQLEQLPSHLPVSLQQFSANSNNLVELPDSLPSSLQLLAINNNQLCQLPSHLPSCLERLYVANNRLMALPDRLPMSLTKLLVSKNCLTALPDSLPPLLQVLNVNNNQLQQLPPWLPSGLSRLYVNNNQLTSLPDILPEGLTSLFAEHNPLTHLPTILPSTLRLLYVNPVLLPEQSSTTQWHPYLHYSLPRVTLRRCDRFMNQIALWTSDTTPWQTIQHQPDSRLFGKFLQKLYQGRHEQNQQLKACVADWLGYLAKQENQALRVQTFSIAEEASRNCVDRASFYFNQMYIAMQEDQLMKREIPVRELFQANRGFFRLQILEQVAAEQTSIRRKANSDFTEELEIYLAYQYQLRHSLSLPIYAEQQYTRIAKVTDSELQAALTTVYQQERKHFIRYLVTKSDTWRNRLEKWNNDAVQAVDQAYLEYIDSVQFNQTVNRALLAHGLLGDNDAHRMIVKKQSDDLLYRQRYPLTEQLLTDYQALDLINDFDYPGKESAFLTEK